MGTPDHGDLANFSGNEGIKVYIDNKQPSFLSSEFIMCSKYSDTYLGSGSNLQFNFQLNKSIRPYYCTPAGGDACCRSIVHFQTSCAGVTTELSQNLE